MKRMNNLMNTGTNVPVISVVIITWNRKADVLETVQAVYDQAYKNFEIIVVDNGSNDGTVEALAQTYPGVRTVALDRNMGVSYARNAGIALAEGEIVVCLDSDASPAKNMFDNIVKKLYSDPKIGVINSKIVNAYTRQIDGIAGWSYSENDLAFQNMEFLSFSFSEGGCAIRKAVFDQVGPFWEHLFFGYEGMEFSLRVLDAGYDILYYPSSLVFHRASPYSRIRGGQREEMLFSHCLSVYLLRFPWWMLLIFAPLKMGATFFRGARYGYFVNVLRGWKNFLWQAPTVLRERKPIKNKTAQHYVELQRQHGPLSWNLVTWLKYKT